jgi:hypothetical protein
MSPPHGPNDDLADELPPVSPPQDTPDGCECEIEKIRYKAQVDLLLASTQRDHGLERVEAETEFATLRAFHDALVDVSKASIARATSGAESVRTAAGAIGVIYTGILGLSFSVSDNPLPIRGLIPAVFLGIAIVMATAYLAYPTEPVSSADWPSGGRSTPENLEERTTAFIEWVVGLVTSRGYALRVAVVSLAFGVVFLPVGFLALGSGTPQGLAELTPAWPPAPEGVLDPELRATLFEAQVAETAEARGAAIGADPAESWEDWRVRLVYITAALALVLMLLHPLLLRALAPILRRLASKPSDQAKSPSP